MVRLQRLVVVAVFVAVGLAASARHAQASLWQQVGDAYCHTEAPGPRYFHSGVREASRRLSHNADWWPSDDQVRRRLERQALASLAAEFARHVAEHHEVEYLLSPRCVLTEPGSGTAEVEAAAYARDGMLVPYEASHRTAVDWSPDYRSAFRRAAAASRRVALVIGNDMYTEEQLGMRPLPASVNDAEDVGAALERMGFDTTVLLDAGADAIDAALRVFAQQATNAEIALVFFSGLGLEAQGVNYLVGVGARLETAADLPLAAVTLDSVVAAAAGARVPVVILDACRDNPLAEYTNARLGPLEVSPVDAGEFDAGVLVAFATTAGGLSRTTRRNGMYTAALLDHLEIPDLELEVMFRRVGAAVAMSTNGRQRPAVYSTLTTTEPILLAGQR